MLAPAASGAAGNLDPAQSVKTVDELPLSTLEALFRLHGLAVSWVERGEPIPGSYWGEREAGLIGGTLYLRADTPVHSALHEACHYICMDDARRAALHTDAKGDDVEEAGVCYLQALLAARLPGYSQAQLFAEMDAWGYTFVLGSAQAWFERDAQDGRDWLLRHGLIDADETPLLRRREASTRLRMAW